MNVKQQKKPHILMAGPDRSVHGGISAVVNGYYAAGLDKKVDLKYIGTMKEGSKIYKLLVAICAYIRFLRRLGWADIVHIHVASDSSFMRKSMFIKAAYRHNKRIIIHQHGGDFIRYHDEYVDMRIRDKMDRILNMADTLLVLSLSWKSYFSNIIPERKIVVMPNGISLDTNVDYGDVEEGHDINKILFLGRICVDKGINELIDAIIDLRREYRNIELYLGGTFEERTDDDKILKKRVEENGDFIRCLGWVEGKEKEKALLECGIFVLPSHYEGFPVSILEAMSFGCIVVSSDVGSVPEIISDNRTGVLVKPHDCNSIREAIAEIISNPKRYDKIKKNAFDMVCSKYSMEYIVDNIEKVYCKM